MANVLADLALESEAATAACDAARARIRSGRRAVAARALARIVTPAAKYWICKRAIAATAEAMEVLGGNGYVEENPLPRLYREAPVNSIWEGSGNIVCLDVERAIRREPDAVDALQALIASARGANATLRSSRRNARIDAARHARRRLGRPQDRAGGGRYAYRPRS